MAIVRVKFLWFSAAALASLPVAVFPALKARQALAQDAGAPLQQQSVPPDSAPDEGQDPEAGTQGTQRPGKKKLEADKAKADADKAKAKAKADKQEQLEADKDKVDADKAKAEADKEEQLEADRAKADADKAKAEADKAKANADKEEQLEADKAKAEADKQKQLEADKAKPEADKQEQLETDNKADADKQKQLETDKAKAEADKQKQPPQSDADRARGQSGSRDGARVPERRLEPANEKQAVEQLKQERVKADDEFEKAKREADQQRAPASKAGAQTQDRERRREGGENRFEELRKHRRERVEDGGRRAVIEEPDKRVIIIEKDRSFVRHDETKRFGRTGKEVKRERQKDGTILTIFLSLAGFEILTLEDEQGHLLRRSRRGPDGREIVLVDNRRFYSSRPRRSYIDAYVDLPPPVVRIPREKYVVEYDDASGEDVYEALSAPPVERLERGYALDEVRESRWLRERMRRVDLNAINFAFASWEVEQIEYPKLEHLADAIKRILNRNPDEMFLIEGHTDAVGSDIDNLSLSDRRAESVAIILSDTFRVPPENLTTQGYGEQYLKVPTEGPSRENRRVAIRRITPLLSRADR